MSHYKQNCILGTRPAHQQIKTRDRKRDLNLPVVFNASLEILRISDVEDGLAGERPDGQLHTAGHTNKLSKIK